MSLATVSRSGERRAVDELLDSAASRPSALVIAGEPGIGKTTVWLAGVEQARELDFHVLSTRADEAESALSHAAIADLLADVEPEVFDGVSELERVTLDGVLLRTGTGVPPTDHRVTGCALASVVATLGARRPVLLAIDDVQWLDAPSRSVLSFAASRLTGRVALLMTAGAIADEPDPVEWLQLGLPGAVRRVRIGPLSPGAVHTLILERFGRALPRSTMARIAEASGGNPLFALELARGAEQRPATGDSAVPDSLTELVRLRTAHFDGVVGDLLLAACSVADATVGLLARAANISEGEVVNLLDGPTREGVVRIDGASVHFVHPLLAHGIYTDAGAARRRRMHRALAAVEVRPESRARHMALGAASADPDTLEALDEAAAVAVRRGAAAAAADLYELAIGLGGGTPDRRLSAAEQHLRAGEVGQVRRVLDPALDDFAPGRPRAAALYLLGAARLADHDYPGALRLLSAAVDEARDDPDLLVRAQLVLTRAQSMTGEHDAARVQAARAVADAERVGDAKLISQAVSSMVLLDCAHGRPRDEAALTRAVRLEGPDPDVAAAFQASVTDAVTTAWAGRFDEALPLLITARRRCIDVGADADVVYVAGHLSMVYTWLGRYSVAVDVANDIIRRGETAGGDYPLVIGKTQRGLASAYLGQERAAREDARDAIAGARQCGARSLAMWSLVSLGFLEVSLGRYAEALKVLQPLLSHRPSADILQTAYVADAVEAMVAMGRTDEAWPLVEALEGHAAAPDRPWSSAIGGRCRGMMQAAGGELAEAEATLQQALIAHDRLPMPFERARTQLLLGRVLRRQRRKNLAVSTLREALATFDDLSVPLWSTRAAAELERTDGPRATDSDLTPSELRVARLAAAGMSNKDIAGALFISPKTVEHNLSHVYRKLGVRTRAELASRTGESGPR